MAQLARLISVGGSNRHEIDYDLSYDGDDHSTISASSGLDHDALVVHDVSEEGGRVVFSVDEKVKVASPCSHVYWAWDQIIRARSNGENHIVIHNRDGQLVFAAGNHALNPVNVLRTHGEDAILAECEKSTAPEWHFEKTMAEIRKEAEHIFLGFDAYAYAHQFRSFRTCSPQQAHRGLETCAEKLRLTYTEDLRRVGESAQPSAAKMAVMTHMAQAAVEELFYMIRRIILRDRLRADTVRSISSVQVETNTTNFWAQAHQFFERLPRTLLGEDTAPALAEVRETLLAQAQSNESPNGARRDTQLARIIDSWLQN